MGKPVLLERGHSNYFQTSGYAVQPLLKYLQPESIIYDPAMGKGNLIKAFQDAGFPTIGSELLPVDEIGIFYDELSDAYFRTFCEECSHYMTMVRPGHVHCYHCEGDRGVTHSVNYGIDFLTSPLADAMVSVCDIIITNPPYTIKDAFLKKCYESGKPFALMMPLTALESQARQSLYRKYGLQLVLLNKRVRFETPSGRKGKQSSPWFASAWFTNGLDFLLDLIFEEIEYED